MASTRRTWAATMAGHSASLGAAWHWAATLARPTCMPCSSRARSPATSTVRPWAANASWTRVLRRLACSRVRKDRCWSVAAGRPRPRLNSRMGPVISGIRGHRPDVGPATGGLRPTPAVAREAAGGIGPRCARANHQAGQPPRPTAARPPQPRETPIRSTGNDIRAGRKSGCPLAWRISGRRRPEILHDHETADPKRCCAQPKPSRSMIPECERAQATQTLRDHERARRGAQARKQALDGRSGPV